MEKTREPPQRPVFVTFCAHICYVRHCSSSSFECTARRIIIEKFFNVFVTSSVHLVKVRSSDITLQLPSTSIYNCAIRKICVTRTSSNLFFSFIVFLIGSRSSGFFYLLFDALCRRPRLSSCNVVCNISSCSDGAL